MRSERDRARFEWDSAKNETNVAKHGIGFVDAIRVFDDPFILEEDSTRPEHGETRYRAIGNVADALFTVIFTFRDERRRIISARRARPDERERYRRRRAAR